LLLALLAAWWLSRLTVAPLRRFERAVAALGRGETPDLLDESGPRELAALARRFNHLTTQVRELLDARTTLLAGLSHDLRTPLTSIRSFAEILGDNPEIGAEQRQEFLGIINGECLRLVRMINDLLDFAKIEACASSADFTALSISSWRLLAAAAASASALRCDSRAAFTLSRASCATSSGVI